MIATVPFLFSGGFWIILAAVVLSAVAWRAISNAPELAPDDPDGYSNSERVRLAEVIEHPTLRLRRVTSAVDTAGDHGADFAWPESLAARRISPHLLDAEHQRGPWDPNGGVAA